MAALYSAFQLREHLVQEKVESSSTRAGLPFCFYHSHSPDDILYFDERLPYNEYEREKIPRVRR
jgi:hypothetical protein